MSDEYAPVRVADLLRIHPAGKEEHEGGDAHEQKATRKVRVDADVGVVGVNVGQDLVEEPLIGHTQEIRLKHDLTQQKGNYSQKL